MKIGQPSEIPASVAQTATSVAQKAAQSVSTNPTAANKSPRSAGVAVSVSSLARALETNETSETSDVDSTKVATVKAAIADGSYVVNPEAIADQLLANAQEMLNRTTR